MGMNQEGKRGAQVNGQKRHWIAYSVMGVGVLAVSFAAILIKMTSAPASVTAAYRMWMTVLLLSPFALRGIGPAWRALTGRDKIILGFSGAALAVHFIFWINSLFYTSVASATLLLALQPIFALLGAHILFRERVKYSVWLFALIAVIGTALIGWRDIRLGGTAAYGDLLAVIGTVAVTAYMLAGQRVRQVMSAMHYSFLVYVVAGVVLTLYSVARGYSLYEYPASDWRAFILLALIPTILGHTLFNTLLKYLPASTIAMSIVGEPIGATALAYVIFGDAIPRLWYLGATLVVLGIVLFMRAAHRSHADRQGVRSVKPGFTE